MRDACAPLQKAKSKLPLILASDLRAVPGGIIQCREFGGIGETDFVDPSLSKWVRIQQGGIGFDGFITLDHLAGYR